MVGLVHELSTMVDEHNTADAVGSGMARVFATPMMILLMEKTAASCIAPELDEGFVSVGTHVNVRHTSASPIGTKITAKAEVLALNGRLVEFRVTAWDDTGLIGEGTHTRAVVNLARFQEKANEKAQK